MLGMKTTKFNILDHKEKQYSLTVKIENKKTGWEDIVAVVYGPNDDKYRPTLWKEMKDIHTK